MKKFATTHLFSIAVALLISTATALEVVLAPIHPLTINSSMNRNSLSLSLSSHGHIGETFTIMHEFLPLKEHQFTLSAKGFTIEPAISEDFVIFNDFDGSEYWLTLKHPLPILSTEDEDLLSTQSRFFVIKVATASQQKAYILPAFPQPFSCLAVETFYKCAQTVLSIAQRGGVQDVSVFGPQNKQWKLEGQWEWSWKHSGQGFIFGRQTRSSRSGFTIRLADGYCSYNSSETKNHSWVPSSSSFTYHELWRSLAELAFKQDNETREGKNDDEKISEKQKGGEREKGGQMKSQL